MAKNSPWGVLAVLGTIVAGAIGIVALVEHNASAKPATPPPQPQPSPAGAPINYLATITDPATVRKYQTMAAGSLTATPNQFGVTLADYGPADVDGNPSNPKWMHLLSMFQASVNLLLPAAIAAGKTPAGFPSQLRTDGVLDQATALVWDLG